MMKEHNEKSCDGHAEACRVSAENLSIIPQRCGVIQFTEDFCLYSVSFFSGNE